MKTKGEYESLRIDVVFYTEDLVRTSTSDFVPVETSDSNELEWDWLG